MSRTSTGSLETKELLATARKYRRAGYRVTMPQEGDPLPSFLDGLVPDLVAERDGDHVVVEVKRADTVAGSNDIVALAEKIAPQQDWRFELISVPATRKIDLPDADGGIGGDLEKLVDLGFTKPAYLVTYAMIENLLAYAAVSNGLNPANLLPSALTRKLANLGIISGETRDLIEKVANKRNRLAHSLDEKRPSKDDIYAVVRLADHLRHEITEVEAA